MRINEGLVFPKMTSRDLKQAKRDYLISSLCTPVKNSPQRNPTPQSMTQIGQLSAILIRTEQQRIQRKGPQGEIPAEGNAQSRRSSQGNPIPAHWRGTSNPKQKRCTKTVGKAPRAPLRRLQMFSGVYDKGRRNSSTGFSEAHAPEPCLSPLTPLNNPTANAERSGANGKDRETPCISYQQSLIK